MKKLLGIMGVIAFWLAWPLLWVYFRRGLRTRVIVEHDGYVLVVKTWLGTGKWILPGGGLHRNEKPGAGAVRELQEETGLQLNIKQLQSLGEGVISQHGLQYRYIAYYAKLDRLEPLRPKLTEISDAAWLPLAELMPAITSRDALTVLGQWSRKR